MPDAQILMVEKYNRPKRCSSVTNHTTSLHSLVLYDHWTKCICGEMQKMPGLKIDHIIVGVAKQPMGPVLVNNHFAGTQPHLLVFSRAAFMLHQN